MEKSILKQEGQSITKGFGEGHDIWVKLNMKGREWVCGYFLY